MKVLCSDLGSSNNTLNKLNKQKSYAACVFWILGKNTQIILEGTHGLVNRAIEIAVERPLLFYLNTVNSFFFFPFLHNFFELKYPYNGNHILIWIFLKFCIDFEKQISSTKKCILCLSFNKFLHIVLKYLFTKLTVAFA